MSPSEKEVIRSGTWLYDGCVEARVRILKIKGSGYEEDEEGPQSPPEDANGFYYVAEFRLPPFDSLGNGSTSWGHATADEAIKYAEEILPSRIRWEPA
jgi:hypothetical protein